MAILFGVLCAILICVVAALVVVVRRQEREIAEHVAHVEQLESDLAVALRPPPAQWPIPARGNGDAPGRVVHPKPPR